MPKEKAGSNDNDIIGKIRRLRKEGMKISLCGLCQKKCTCTLAGKVFGVCVDFEPDDMARVKVAIHHHSRF